MSPDQSGQGRSDPLMSGTRRRALLENLALDQLYPV
jgi:hypothetical protein